MGFSMCALVLHVSGSRTSDDLLRMVRQMSVINLTCRMCEDEIGTKEEEEGTASSEWRCIWQR